MPLLVRRLSFAAPTLVLAVALAWLSIETVRGGEHSGLDWILCALFVAVMAWECSVLAEVALGFATWALGRAGLSPLERRALAIEPRSTGRSRTAIVIPIFDEDVEAVFARVEITLRSLARLGRDDDIEIHVLSDTRDPVIAAAEARAAARLAGSGAAVRYRRREVNDGRKVGNLLEFLERTRGTYDFMIVLDADSLMSGTSIRKLIRLMEENERVALIQTISFAASRNTLFARIQQFAVRLHAPLSFRGTALWQGPDGVYFGHNAIVRCEPFLQHATLPVLSGKPPLGGEILCHDVVEAALLRRAGWEVCLLPDIDGTWEEMPTNVVDLLGREKRWCQGNLQHSRVLPMPGLTLGSRCHIARGILGYLVGSIWWAFVLLGACRVFLDDGPDLGVLAYGLTEPTGAARALFWLSAAVLVLPRILNVLRAFVGAKELRGFGGPRSLFLGAVLEQAFSLLLMPLLSLVTVRFVAQTLRGTVVPWTSQSRADREVGWREAIDMLRVNLGVGAVLLAAMAIGGGWYALWMLPTVAGLLLGPILIVGSSRLDLGLAARRLGLFLTPDETHTAPELRELDGAAPPEREPARAEAASALMRP